jgi:hypothetical protein
MCRTSQKGSCSQRSESFYNSEFISNDLWSNGDEEYLPLWGRRAQNAGHAEVLNKFSRRLNNVVTEFCQSVDDCMNSFEFIIEP